jgi:hypothetical protein
MAFREFDVVQERMRQRRAVLDAELRQQLNAGVGVFNKRWRELDEGTRVFDRVSGEEGVIVGRTSENVIVPTARRADGGDRVREAPERADRAAES